MKNALFIVGFALTTLTYLSVALPQQSVEVSEVQPRGVTFQTERECIWYQALNEDKRYPLCPSSIDVIITGGSVRIWVGFDKPWLSWDGKPGPATYDDVFTWPEYQTDVTITFAKDRCLYRKPFGVMYSAVLKDDQKQCSKNPGANEILPNPYAVLGNSYYLPNGVGLKKT